MIVAVLVVLEGDWVAGWVVGGMGRGVCVLLATVGKENRGNKK